MKRLILTALASLAMLVAVAAGQSYDYVILNSGNVIKGVIIAETPGQSVTIKADNGQTYTYNMVNVRKITRGEAPNLPDGSHSDPNVWTLSSADKGFWWTVEAGAGVTCRLHHSNRAFAEADVTLGYRFNQYARIGAGVGFRNYFNMPADMRSSSISCSFPLYLNLRGNLTGDLYRSVVPYYSIDLGGAIRDGLMFRPAVGVRFGQQRSAFTLALSYVGQELPVIANDEPGGTVTRKFTSMVALRAGWEF